MQLCESFNVNQNYVNIPFFRSKIIVIVNSYNYKDTRMQGLPFIFRD